MNDLPTLQDEVALWLKEKHGQWPTHIPPPRLRRAKRRLRLTLLGLHPALSVVVTPYELRVSADVNGRNLDTLLWLEVEPIQMGGGWGCALCESFPAEDSPPPQPFASAAALRRDHLLEPFFRWCHEKLAPATHLELWEGSDGCSFAELMTVPPAVAKPEWRRLWTRKGSN